MTNKEETARFILHPQLASDTLEAFDYGLSSLRLMNDRRFYWLVIVPRIPDACEIFDLPTEIQAQTMREISDISSALKQVCGCDKINMAAFGNMVPQLHIHVIARFKTDPAWPGSAIGFAGAEAYAPGAADMFIKKLRAGLRRKIMPTTTPTPLF